MKLRLGLIGHGDSWQTRHAPALRVLHDRFDLRAVFSSVPKLGENIAAEFQADATDGYRALVSRQDIDAVIILQRSWLGWLPMLAACEAGKAVYWAGDLDVSVDRDNHVRQAIEDSGVSFMAEFPRRFAPATLRLKELIATRLGSPQMIFCHRRMFQQEANRQQSGGGAVRQELLEMIDWCRYVVGRSPSSVSSLRHPTANSETGIDSKDAKNPSADRAGSGQSGLKNAAAGHCDFLLNSDYHCISLNFDATEASPPVTVQLSCGTYVPAEWQEALGFRSPAAMHICCQRGVAFIDLPSSLVWFDEAGRNMESLDTEMPVGQHLLSQFHRNVTSLLRSVSDLSDVFVAAEILEAAERSVNEKRWVDVCN